MKKTLHTILTVLLLGGLGLTARAQSCPTLVWSDEFDGTSLNLSNWEVQTGDGCQEGICGWGNNELQFYKAENLVVSNGTLKIIAKKERVQSKQYTSGRIRSMGLQDFTFGRMEARIKLPAGQGFWPAFWMLSTNEPYGGWPQSGEIDIMEFLGQNTEDVLGTIHYGEVYPNNQNQGNHYVKYDGTNFVDDFHVFAVEWEAGEIRWYVDNVLYSTKTSADVAPFNWPFDAGNQMHFLLNLAVGGNLPGSPDNSTPFPSTMEVDYVRVYDMAGPALAGERLVLNQESGVTYTVTNAPGGTNYSWSVPAGATITSGANSNSITVDFGSSSGDVTCVVSSGCGSSTLSTYVLVEPPFTKDFSLENFDDPAQATLVSTNGTLTTVSNPDNSGINPSANSGQYVRDAASQYDVIAYDATSIGNADDYANRTKKFYLDLYTDAPVGTTILIQLESDAATPTNYPGGRHSRYQATTTVRNGWQRLVFDVLDRPDQNIAGVDATNLLILVAPNTFTGDTYVYDNLDSYIQGTGGPSNQAPSVSVTSPSNGASFDDGTSVSLAASASDSDGSVTSVEFFVNGSSVGTDNTSPYGVNWTIGVGSYDITAVATDDQGATTTSAAVSITGNSLGGGNPDPMVTNIVTSLASKGPNTSATADITVTSNGSPVAGAVVDITWSGDDNSSASGTTDGSGVVSFTSANVRNGANFTVTITSVTASGYVWDVANSETSETAGSGARTSLAGDNTPAIGVDVFPNPMNETLTLRFPADAGTVTVRMIDLTGRVQWEQQVQTEQSQHTLGHLPTGTYVLQVIGQGWQYQQRVVKQ